MHRLSKRIEKHWLALEIWRVHDWVIAPLTLQALDFAGIGEHIVHVLRTRREFDADFILLLKLIDDPPSPQKIALMKEHEAAVAEGRYDGLAKEPKRYDELEAKIRSDPLLLQFWTRLRSRYAPYFRPNARGVVRRTLARERGFDCRRSFHWAKKRDRMQITFDALCHRWCLYGYEKDSALALKLTANLTPHGTMIFVPRGMSLAANRTFVWAAITAIHRAHGASRQGEKLFEIRIQHRKDRAAARAFDEEARAKKLRGAERYRYILLKMGQLPNRVRWLRRLLHDS